jgi:hypothetical protein
LISGRRISDVRELGRYGTAFAVVGDGVEFFDRALLGLRRLIEWADLAR